MTNAKSIKVGIIDYGIGNHASLQGALQRLGYRVVLGRSEAAFAGVSCVFLPGVGALPFAMSELKATGLDRFVTRRFEAGDIRLVGICLGMQLFYEHSEEGDASGLGLLQGRVKAFERGECHVGWNIVRAPSWAQDDPSVRAYYFNHSYYVDCPREHVIGSTSYLGEMPAQVAQKQFIGVQFHPEKSQSAGQVLLKKLIEE